MDEDTKREVWHWVQGGGLIFVFGAAVVLALGLTGNLGGEPEPTTTTIDESLAVYCRGVIDEFAAVQGMTEPDPEWLATNEQLCIDGMTTGNHHPAFRGPEDADEPVDQ